MAGIGWIGSIILGGIAGWIAEKVMKSDMGLLLNIVLGIVGALVANFLLSLVLGDTVGEGSWLIQLLVAVVGACLLIWVVRLVKGRS